MEKLRYKNLDYVIRLPESFDERSRYPLVFYIHGAGGRGRDINTIYDHAFFTDTAPFLKDAVSVAPQCFSDSWFDIFEQLVDFIEYIISHPYVDKDRVYLIGASMGGYTTWQLAMSRPDLFAAIIPICGGGMYWNAARLIYMGVWAFHGDIDNVVKCEESAKMVESINQKGGDARLTVYPDTGHNAWTPTFTSPEVWKWLLSNKRNAKYTYTAFNDTKKFG